MQDNELLAEWVNDLARDIRGQIGELSHAQLYWQPDAEANSIGITVWHVARGIDLLLARALENRPAEEEQWHTRGWREQTGYDPRGIGFEGWGVITGYTQEEVKAIPHLSATELLTYLDQVCFATRDYLRALTPDALHQNTPFFGGTRTRYRWVKGFLKGSLAHVGEIQAMIEMQKRLGKG